ncbi:transposase [Mucilaginibacter boryungensis]|uniref:Transposase n=1 Tax=Mucilaginibacter boryungensis TaxID=768480 RepID=A0ABR9XIX8_9SPHI|nr:transposase [Mucilaginibacter boryungensis]MBE9667332.1 transposase [Mucilaginibacter boryungensis]
MPSYDYLHRAEFWLLITTLVYFLMNGAQIFETAVIIPRWTANAPASFSLLKGIDLKTFWIVMHSVHEITFMAAIYFCWDLGQVRNWLLLLFGIHFAVRVWTIVYFAPIIIRFQKNENLAATDEELQIIATRWRKLNYIRVGLFVAISIAMVFTYFLFMSIRY